jgi:hypothetical protein
MSGLGNGHNVEHSTEEKTATGVIAQILPRVWIKENCTPHPISQFSPCSRIALPNPPLKSQVYDGEPRSSVPDAANLNAAITRSSPVDDP